MIAAEAGMIQAPFQGVAGSGRQAVTSRRSKARTRRRPQPAGESKSLDRIIPNVDIEGEHLMAQLEAQDADEFETIDRGDRDDRDDDFDAPSEEREPALV